MWSRVVLGGVFLACAWMLHPLVVYYGIEGVSRIPRISLLRFISKVRLQSWILGLSGIPRNLPTLPAVAQLSNQVLRVLGSNASQMTLEGTNVYIVGTGPSRVLIDSSDGNATFVRSLGQVCRRHEIQEISDFLLLTHGHLDHVGGLLQLKKLFPKINVWKYLPVEGKEGDGDGDRRLGLSNEESRRLGIQALVDGQEFQLPGTGVLTTVYTPGHCNDHVCFVLGSVNGLDAPVLFSGDCVLGFGSCMFDSLADLMASLTKLSTCGAGVIYPGHGPVVSDAPTKILEYIAHRQQREDEVLDVLKKYGDLRVEGLSSSDIVDRVYTSLPYLLRVSARKAVDKHLQKLLLEARIRQIRRAGWFQTATYILINDTSNKRVS